jgi:predicted phosphodiesterase
VRLGFLSDAHGNPMALEVCLRALADAGAEQLHFLGDAVGYMPGEAEVLEQLRAAGAVCIRGNHEAMLLGELPVSEQSEQVYRLAGARARLRPEHRAWIATWPLQRELEVAGRRLLLVHGSPQDPLGGYIYPDTDLAAFAGLPYDRVLLGQTHRPFVRAAGPVEVVNIGSSGMPRDVGNLASCAIYDSSDHKMQLLRCPFDAEAVIAAYADQVDTSVIACLRRA